MGYKLLAIKTDKPLSIKQIIDSARSVTLSYLISLTLMISLSIFVYFSLDKIIAERLYSANSVSVSESQIKVAIEQNKQALRTYVFK